MIRFRHQNPELKHKLPESRSNHSSYAMFVSVQVLGRIVGLWQWRGEGIVNSETSGIDKTEDERIEMRCEITRDFMSCVDSLVSEALMRQKARK